MNGTVTSSNATGFFVEWKPIGRGRRFDRLARGLARRFRLPWVRRLRYEYDHPETQRYPAASWGLPWTSTNALADFSFACTCHKRDRYSRKGKRKNVR